MRMISALTVLEKTSEILAERRSWAQGELAVDEHGDSVLPEEGDDIVAWCLIGALDTATLRLFGSIAPERMGGRALVRAMRAVYQQLPWYVRRQYSEEEPEEAIAAYNDSRWRRHRHIRRLLRRATAAERVRELAA